MIQEREKIVLETLEKIPKQNAVLIGGYAINAYVPPRFSIDCDLVILDNAKAIEDALKRDGYAKEEGGDVPYGNYIRYVREKEKVSFDLLVNSVLDRESGVVFKAGLFEKYSRKRVTVGRANPIRIEMRIADPELLFAMKFVSARKQDIRDVFMLAGEDLEWDLIIKIISEECSSDMVKKRIDLIKHSIESKGYRDSIHGPFGKMPDERFNSCKKRLLDFLGKL
ncbi:MAG: nucleotidyl transferase AbiEii/AbiGii toxin family protein [Thaumarchaeota archaeon]|nr:nucleotidyl transferase AbiEii/AbiGii toxin family protein [Nitrososphaerota archaeon]